MDSKKINTMFPTFYAIKNNSNHKKHKEDLVNFCYKMKKKKPQSETWEKVGNSQDQNYYGSILQNDSAGGAILLYKEFKPILEFITKVVEELGEELKFPENIEHSVTSSWLNINSKNSWHRPHSHGGHLWSGVYYIKTDENSAPICFPNSVGSYQQHWPGFEIDSPYSCDMVSVIPKEGDLIIFPSWLVHYVPLHTGDEDRINIAFNID